MAAGEANAHTVRRVSSLKRTEAIICNIGAMLASLVVGCDVMSRTASPESAADQSAASVRHVMTEDVQHHTYHGCQIRYRPTVYFDLPIRYAESSYDDCCYDTPSSDQPPADSRHTTPSLSAKSFFSADSSCQSPPSNRQSVADSASSADLALISLSPSTDEAFVEYQRQFFDTGWAVVDASTWTAVKSDDVATPSSCCLASDALATTHCADTDGNETAAGSQCLAGIPNALSPPPVTRRQLSLEHVAERPVTLDIIPRPRPLPSILKNASPIHATPYSSPRSRVTPSSDCSTSYTQSPYNQRRVSLSADQRKTLLDIDAEGQTSDSTKPLSVTSMT